jgi:hypothetical protein
MESTTILPATLYPRLVSDRTHPIYSHDLGRHMVRKVAWEMDEVDRPVTIPMLEDIHVQFVQDREAGFDLVLERDRQGAEVKDNGSTGEGKAQTDNAPATWTDMDLIQQSFRNLKENLGENMDLLTLENGLVRIVSGTKYEASFLLLGNLWMQLENEYGAQLYAAIPSHNALFIARQDNRRAILEMQTLIRNIFFEAAPEALLSKAVYQRFDGEWKIIATAF